MNERAENLAPEADEAVRAYIRMNRSRLAQDGSFLAMLVPERFGGEVHDLQRHVIERLRAENTALRSKLDAVERAVKAWGNPPTP
ncbi:MAG: hypothetical protein JOZ72_06355 [Alphaproteobacteria bacterium]|nr:hypothetical protein [Alphaproteobacteria bacterium]